MTKTFGFVTAAALLASVTAFAQNATPSSDTSVAPAASDTAKTDDSAAKPMHRHHGHHGTTMSKGTDWNADKLNSCMSNATPTSEQESCLKHASGTGNG